VGTERKTSYKETVGIPAAFYSRKLMIPVEFKYFYYCPLSKDLVQD